MKKIIKTYEEFIGDETTDKEKEQALAQAAKDGDKIYTDGEGSAEDSGSGESDNDDSGDEMGA